MSLRAAAGPWGLVSLFLSPLVACSAAPSPAQSHSAGALAIDAPGGALLTAPPRGSASREAPRAPLPPAAQGPASETSPPGAEQAPTPSSAALAAPEALAAPTSLAAPAPLAELPRGTKVLHVGDSFAGALGIPLGKRLEERGVNSILKHVDASYLTTWAWQEDLERMVWKYNPDLVLITLGANELAIVEPQQRARAIHKIIASLGGRPCVWVAIPLWNGPGNGLLEVIAAESRPCAYLDTNALMDTAHMARISDGIHPTSSARERWADVVLEWLSAERIPDGARPWDLRAMR